MAPPANAGRAVILLHGLGRGRGVMRRLERRLHDAGWIVANVGYPSLRRPLAFHADAVSGIAQAMHEDGAGDIAFVGHSLGGLIARLAASHAARDDWPLGRIVLIGSPARGSAVAESLKDFWPFRIIARDCGQALTFVQAKQVPIPAADIAIIAGGNGTTGYNRFLKGDNDGLVTVGETRLGQLETDFLLLTAIHTALPMRAEAITATLNFLEIGRLQPQAMPGRS